MCLKSAGVVRKKKTTTTLTVFASNKSQAYYKLLLKDPRDCHSALLPSQCKLKSLADGMPEVVEYSAPEPAAPLPLGVDGDSDDDVTLSALVKRIGPARARADSSDEDADAPVVDGSDGEAQSSKNSTSDGAAAVADEPRRVTDGDSDEELKTYPDSIEGVWLGIPEMHAGLKDIGFRVRCPRHGGACRRFRSVHLDVADFGKRVQSFTWAPGSSVAMQKPCRSIRSTSPQRHKCATTLKTIIRSEKCFA